MSALVRHPGAKTYRGPTTDLWKEYDGLVADDPFYGSHYFNDFLGDTDEWTVVQLNSGTNSTFLCKDGGAFGTALLIQDSTTDGEGGQAQLGGAAYARSIGRLLVYEALVRLNSPGSGTDFADMFVGLADKAGTAIMNTSGVLVAPGIGFVLGASGALSFTAYRTSASVEKATQVTIADGVWTHLGFSVDPRTNRTVAYINNRTDQISTAVSQPFFAPTDGTNALPATTDFLTPTFATATGGTNGNLEVDWVRVGMYECHKVR